MGFNAACEYAKDKAKESRILWKAVAGEAYGDKKAEGWAPPVADVVGNATAKAENAEKQAKAVEAELSAAQQELGAARQAVSAQREQAARIERLREQAGMVERIRARLATAEENAANCRAQLVAAGGEDPKAPGSYLLRGLASVTAEFVAEAEGSGEVIQVSQETFSLLTRARAHLAEYRKLHGDPNAEPSDPARAEEIRRGLQTAESGATNARRDLAAAEAAAAELADLGQAGATDEGRPDVDAIIARITDLTERRSQWQADARKYRDAAGATERRSKQIADAAQHHADVQQWSAIAEALSPDGIQAEMIAEALTPLNKLLAEHAALAQWAPVLIGADMSITAAGRSYPLLSESEKWRADALLAVAIAVLSGLRFVVLDRLDVLDTAGREDALYWLSDVAEAGLINTALVLATLKAAPPASALPPHIASHWIERGNLVATNEPVREAA